MKINDILKTPKSNILSVCYDTGAYFENEHGINEENLYLAELVMQYHTLTKNACLAFTIECLVSVNDGKVTIEQMDTSSDIHNVYINNIEGLPNGSYNIWTHDIDEQLHETLVSLLENEDVDTIPEHFTVESY